MHNSEGVISSKDNHLLKRIRQLQQAGSKGQKARHEYQLAVMDGIHLMQAWQGDPRLQSILITSTALTNPEIAAIIHSHSEQCPDVEIQLIDESLWSSISELEHAPQIMGLVRLELPKDTSKNLRGDTIVLDAIQDAGNVGTILRTALACHFNQIVCTVGTAHIWSPKVLRAAMGAHRYLTFYEAQSIDAVTSNIEAPLLATTMTAPRSLYSVEARLQKPIAWVFGNEGQGVCPELLQQATLIRVPQNPQLESLNVASTAAICLYETLRARGQFNS
jgi:RNA methyltransferase, TrmH family